MAALIRMFPKYAAEIDAWTNAYKRVLGMLGPTELRQTWQATIDTWQRTIPPKPADFAAHRPAVGREPNPEAAAQIRQMQITNAAHVEQKALVDRTLQAYAETLSAYGRQLGDLPPVYSGSIVLRAPDFLRTAFVFLVKRKAWLLAVDTAKGGTPYAHVEIGPADWQQIVEHAETMSRSGGNAGRALQRKPNPLDEQRRAEMRRRADEFHAERSTGMPVATEEQATQEAM
jgi:hypothetical protein